MHTEKQKYYNPISHKELFENVRSLPKEQTPKNIISTKYKPEEGEVLREEILSWQKLQVVAKGTSQRGGHSGYQWKESKLLSLIIEAISSADKVVKVILPYGHTEIDKYFSSYFLNKEKLLSFLNYENGALNVQTQKLIKKSERRRERRKQSTEQQLTESIPINHLERLQKIIFGKVIPLLQSELEQQKKKIRKNSKKGKDWGSGQLKEGLLLLERLQQRERIAIDQCAEILERFIMKIMEKEEKMVGKISKLQQKLQHQIKKTEAFSEEAKIWQQQKVKCEKDWLKERKGYIKYQQFAKDVKDMFTEKQRVSLQLSDKQCLSEITQQIKRLLNGQDKGKKDKKCDHKSKQVHLACKQQAARNQQQIKSLKEVVKSLDSELSILREECENIQSKYMSGSDRINKLQTKSKKVIEENDTLNQKNDQLIQDNNYKNKLIEEYLKIINNLEESMKENEKVTEKIKDEGEGFIQIIKRNQQEKESMLKNMEQIQEKCRNLQQNLDKKQNQQEELIQTVEAREKDFRSADDKCKLLEKQKIKLQENIAKYQVSIQMLEQKISQLIDSEQTNIKKIQNTPNLIQNLNQIEEEYKVQFFEKPILPLQSENPLQSANKNNLGQDVQSFVKVEQIQDLFMNQAKSERKPDSENPKITKIQSYQSMKEKPLVISMDTRVVESMKKKMKKLMEENGQLKFQIERLNMQFVLKKYALQLQKQEREQKQEQCERLNNSERQQLNYLRSLIYNFTGRGSPLANKRQENYRKEPVKEVQAQEIKIQGKNEKQQPQTKPTNQATFNQNKHANQIQQQIIHLSKHPSKQVTEQIIEELSSEKQVQKPRTLDEELNEEHQERKGSSQIGLNSSRSSHQSLHGGEELIKIEDAAGPDQQHNQQQQKQNMQDEQQYQRQLKQLQNQRNKNIKQRRKEVKPMAEGSLQEKQKQIQSGKIDLKPMTENNWDEKVQIQEIPTQVSEHYKIQQLLDLNLRLNDHLNRLEGKIIDHKQDNAHEDLKCLRGQLDSMSGLLNICKKNTLKKLYRLKRTQNLRKEAEDQVKRLKHRLDDALVANDLISNIQSNTDGSGFTIPDHLQSFIRQTNPFLEYVHNFNNQDNSPRIKDASPNHTNLLALLKEYKQVETQTEFENDKKLSVPIESDVVAIQDNFNNFQNQKDQQEIDEVNKSFIDDLESMNMESPLQKSPKLQSLLNSLDKIPDEDNNQAVKGEEHLQIKKSNIKRESRVKQIGNMIEYHKQKILNLHKMLRKQTELLDALDNNHDQNEEQINTPIKTPLVQKQEFIQQILKAPSKEVKGDSFIHHIEEAKQTHVKEIKQMFGQRQAQFQAILIERQEEIQRLKSIIRTLTKAQQMEERPSLRSSRNQDLINRQLDQLKAQNIELKQFNQKQKGQLQRLQILLKQYELNQQLFKLRQMKLNQRQEQLNNKENQQLERMEKQEQIQNNIDQQFMTNQKFIYHMSPVEIVNEREDPQIKEFQQNEEVISRDIEEEQKDNQKQEQKDNQKQEQKDNQKQEQKDNQKQEEAKSKEGDASGHLKRSSSSGGKRFVRKSQKFQKQLLKEQTPRQRRNTSPSITNWQDLVPQYFRGRGNLK